MKFSKFLFQLKESVRMEVNSTESAVKWAIVASVLITLILCAPDLIRAIAPNGFF